MTKAVNIATSNLVTPVLGTVTSGNISACTSTNMVLVTPTFDSASLATISGTAPLYMCRAWVNFNGTGTVAIRASGNVSSITDNATGFFTINLTTAMPDANYSVHGGAGAGSDASRLCANSAVIAPTTTTFKIQTTNIAGADTDAVYTYVAIFR